MNNFDWLKQTESMIMAGADVGNITDGYHTFNELYHHRTLLFATICNSNKEPAWKSRLHSDGTMYDGMFIAGITTIEGNATYHCENRYWDMFDIQEMSNAPVFDGHTSDIALYRIYHLSPNKKVYIENTYNLLVKKMTDFSTALRYLKKGYHVKRSVWPEKRFVTYQKGYPNGIPCNEQTAKAWKLNPGDNFICNPYLQIQYETEGLPHSMWIPNIDDLLAEDWIIMED